MQTQKTELPLLDKFMSTVKQIGPDATLIALNNACAAGQANISDPIILQLIQEVEKDFQVNFADIISFETRGMKKKFALAILGYTLRLAKYKQKAIGILLNNRHASQIYRYHKEVRDQTRGPLFKHRTKYELFIKELIKKNKSKKSKL